jgi:hypothetical protein
MYNPTVPNDPGPGQRGWDVVIVIGGIHGEGEGEKKIVPPVLLCNAFLGLMSWPATELD